MEIIKKLWYKICWYSYTLWLHIRWSSFNPWVLANLNLAYTNYTKTTMYGERKKLNFMTVRKPYSDYAEQAFVENQEILFFTKMFTWKDKLRLILFPFSCGNRHKMPWYLVRDRIIIMYAWIIGIKEEK